MIREHHMAVLPANHVSVFYMEPTTNTQFHAKYTYIIGLEYSHVVLPDHASISLFNFILKATKGKRGLLNRLH